jgi:prepilin peptidase CpaA
VPIVVADERIALLQWGVVIGASLVAAGFDLRTKRVPNAITVPLLITGLIQATSIGGLSGLIDAIGACVLLAMPYVLMFLFAHGGAGDAKFMGAIGAWLGLTQGAIVLFCVAIAGAVLAIARAITQKRLRLVLGNVFVSIFTFMISLTGYRFKQNRADDACTDRYYSLSIPYGVAIFAGVCVAGGFVLLWQR